MSAPVEFGDSRLPARFWKKCQVDDLTGCWTWSGASKGDGYGIYVERDNIGDKWRRHSSHRFLMLAIGIDVDGKDIDHLCRNRACCNPAHLDVVSHRENVMRGVGPTAVNASKTHCKHGHAFTAENTYINPRGHRGCRECERRIRLAGNTKRAALARARRAMARSADGISK